MNFSQLKKNLYKNKSYYITAVASLFLTMYIIVTVFALINTALLKPLPYSKPDDLFYLSGNITYNGSKQEATNPPGLFNVKRELSDLADVAIYAKFEDLRIELSNKAPKIPAFYVSKDFFEVLGVEPEIGRFFNHQERRGANQPSVVLSQSVWRSQFNGEDQVIGERLMIDGVSYTVVGVAPDGWALPKFDGVNDGIWLPHDMHDKDLTRFKGFTTSFGALTRLKDGVSTEEFIERATTPYYRAAEDSLPEYTKLLSPNPFMVPLEQEIKGDSLKVLVMVGFGAILVFLIAIINLTNLQISSAQNNLSKRATCYVFGATRQALLRENFLKNLMLTGTSTGLALGLSVISLDFVADAASGFISKMDVLSVDLSVYLFCFVVMVATALYLSLVDEKVFSSADLVQTLRSGVKGGAKKIKRSTAEAIIFSQVLLSAISITFAALVLQSTLSETLRDNNIDDRYKYTIKIDLSKIESEDGRRSVLHQITDSIQKLEFVNAVTSPSEMRVATLNKQFIYNNKEERIASARIISVDLNYFDFFGMKITGQSFVKGDMDLTYSPVIVNQFMAEKLLPKAIGSTIKLDGSGPHEVIGIASNNYFPGESYRESPEVFMPESHESSSAPILSISLNREIALDKLSNDLVEAVKYSSPRAVVDEVISLEDTFYLLTEKYRFASFVATILFLTSLVLVIAGVYGVSNYMASKRRYEFGVKLSFGATEDSILFEEFRESLRPTIGSLILSFSAVYFSLGYIYTIPEINLSPDWVLIISCLIGVLAVAIAAVVIPVYNALKGDISSSLRSE